MTPTEVDETIQEWKVDSEYCLKYDNYTLYGPEYLVINRKSEELFEVVLDKSSIKVFESFTKDLMIKLLGSDTLKIHNKGTYQVSYRYYKSDSCCCGSWILGKDHPHSDWCAKYVKP